MNQQGKTFSALAVRRPVLIIVMNLLIVIAGAAAVFGIDVRELPNVDRPTVTVRATYDGASPETIDAEVTRVIEGAIARVNGVREIRSSSEENNCRIRIEFQPGVNLTDAANDIREAINRNRRQLPDDVEEVFVVKADDDADPIIQLSAVSNSLSKDELAQKIEKDILPAFLSIQGVAEVRLSGNQKRELRVLLKPEQMSKLKVNVSLVEDVLRNARLDIPAGSYKSGDQELLVRANASMSTPQQIRQLILRENVYLEDVAVVFFAPEEAESYARLNGSIVIGLDVVRQAGANTINISKDVDKQVEHINRRNRDLEIIKTSDDAVFIEGAIHEVLISLLFSVSIVILVIVLFIGSIRATLVPAVAIPISLVGTFSAIWLMGLSINLLTLLALVLATGLIVDDAIVVLENIQRHQKNGVKSMAAAVIGSQQVFFAVIATTVTLVSVFLPITFLPSEAGKLFREFGLVLSVSVIISSVVALTLCPMMASRLSILETEKTWFPMTKSALNFCGQMFGRFYSFSLKICIKFPLICLLSILVLCCGSWPIFQSLKQELVPDEDRGSVRIMLTGPDGASLLYSDRQAEKLETIMYPYYKQGIITNIYTTVGQYDKNRSSIVATLKNWEDRDINQIELTKKIQGRLEEIPGAQARVRGGNSLGVRGGGGGLELALLGNNYTEISAAADALVRAVERLPSVTDARADFDTSQPELSFEIDRRKTNDLGVDITDIARTLRAMVDGYEVARLNINDEEVPIILGSIDGTADDPEDLLNVFMVNNQQNLIPLLSFVHLQESGIAAELDRHKQRRAIEVDIGLKPDAVLSDVVREVEKIGDEVLPSGVNILLLGDAADLGETSHELSLTFGLAILIVFLVLAAQFESIGSAFIVIFTVPFGLAAAIYALHFTGQSINLYSQIGLVMLVGLMTKNSILFVEFMDQLREEGAEVKDAILRGAEIRLRPVMMTVLSTVVGSLPLVLSSGPGSEARSAIGWVIFGGLGLAAFLTLYLTPIGYALIAPFVKPRSHAQKILETQLQEVEKVAS